MIYTIAAVMYYKTYNRMRENKYLLAAIGLMVVVAMVVVINRSMSNDIHISISETRDELSVSASFPDDQSERVQQYVKKQLTMTDLSDLRYVDVKHYETPDSRMRFNIKSRPGFIKIVMNSKDNTSYGYRKLKETAEELKRALGEKR